MVNINKDDGRYRLIKCLLNYKENQKDYDESYKEIKNPEHKADNGWLLARHILEKRNYTYDIDVKELSGGGYKGEFKFNKVINVYEKHPPLYKSNQGNLPNDGKFLKEKELIQIEKFKAVDNKNRAIGGKRNSPNVYRLKRDKTTFNKLFILFLKNGELDYFKYSDYVQDLKEYYMEVTKHYKLFYKILTENTPIQSYLTEFIKIGNSSLYWYYVNNPKEFKQIINTAYGLYKEQGVRSSTHKYWLLLHSIFMNNYFQALCENKTDVKLWEELAKESFYYLNNRKNFEKNIKIKQEGG